MKWFFNFICWICNKIFGETKNTNIAKDSNQSNIYGNNNYVNQTKIDKKEKTTHEKIAILIRRYPDFIESIIKKLIESPDLREFGILTGKGVPNYRGWIFNADDCKNLQAAIYEMEEMGFLKIIKNFNMSTNSMFGIILFNDEFIENL